MSANKTLDGRSFGQKLRSGAFIYTLISIVLGFGVGAVALLAAGYNPLEAYGSLFSVIFSSTKNMSYSFIEFATPYILTGLSVAFSFKTGMFNIGAEEYFFGEGVCVVEWADLIAELLPENTKYIYLQYGENPEERIYQCTF